MQTLLQRLPAALLAAGLALSVGSDARAQSTAEALLVCDGMGTLRYALRGHAPLVPLPVDAIADGDWTFWTPSGTPLEPIPDTAGYAELPQVAYSRLGYWVAVWSVLESYGCCDAGCSRPESYAAHVFLAVFDGETWSAPALVAAADEPDLLLTEPTIAFDPATGDALIVWSRVKILRGECEIVPGPTSLWWRRFDGAMQAPSGPIEMIPGSDAVFTRNASIGLGCASSGPEICFLAGTDAAMEPSTALVLFFKIIGDECPAAVDHGDFIWPFSSTWNGTGFEPATMLPGLPVPVLSGLHYEAAYEYRKLGIAPDTEGNARAVFVVDADLPSGDCDADRIAPYTGLWSALYDGAAGAWTDSARAGDAFTASAFRHADVTFEIDDSALVVFTRISGSTAVIRCAAGVWTPLGTAPGLMGAPAVAAMNHEESLFAAPSGAVQHTLDAPGFRPVPLAIAPSFSVELASAYGGAQDPKLRFGLLAYQAGDQNTERLLNFNEWLCKQNRLQMKAAAWRHVGRYAQFDRHVQASANTIRVLNTGSGEQKPEVLAGNLNAGNRDLLAEFVAAGFEKVQARRYFLVLSDHGGGWIGSCWDTTSPPGTIDNLTLPETRTALRAALVDPSGAPRVLDLIGFQACFMSQLEVAEELSDLAQYLIAHEQVSFARNRIGNGAPWDFEKLLPILDGAVLAKTNRTVAVDLVDAIALHQKTVAKAPTTISAVDLGLIPGLVTKVREMAEALLAAPSDGIVDLRAAVALADSQGKYGGSMSQDFKDLGHLARCFSLFAPGAGAPLMRAKADAVAAAVGAAVIRYQKGDLPADHYPNSTGLAIWAPLDGTKLEEHVTKGLNYGALRFNTTGGVAATGKWLELLHRIKGSVTFVARLNCPDADLILHLEDQAGRFSGFDPLNNQVPGDPDLIAGAMGIRAAIPGSDCADVGGVKTIYVPGATPWFRWTVDGTGLSTSTTFELLIETFIDEELFATSRAAGALAPGLAATGVFPRATLSYSGQPVRGGTITFQLDDADHPGALYLLILALGSSPGLPLGDGRVVPLNPDPLFNASLYQPAAIGLSGSRKNLDAAGRGTATFAIPPGLPPGLGIQAAFVTLDPARPYPALVSGISPAVSLVVE